MGGKGTFGLESMRGIFQVLLVSLLVLNLTIADEEVQEGATEAGYGQILPALSPGLRDKRTRKWDHSNRWGFGSDGHLYDFVKRFDSSRWGGGSDGHLYDFAKRDGPSRTLSPPRDLTHRDGVGVQMAISMILLKSRYGPAYSPRCVKKTWFASFSSC